MDNSNVATELTETKLTSFRCTACGDIIDMHPDDVTKWELEFSDANADCVFCEVKGCDGSYTEIERGMFQTMHMNLYRLDQSYGGPEEGGWYYGTGEALGSIPLVAKYDWKLLDVGGGERTYALRPLVKPEHEEMARAILEVTTYGDRKDFAIRLEPNMAQDYPTRRPHYE
jgi:hypothetical protein